MFLVISQYSSIYYVMKNNRFQYRLLINIDSIKAVPIAESQLDKDKNDPQLI